jgi:hypothetical protein
MPPSLLLCAARLDVCRANIWLSVVIDVRRELEEGRKVADSENAVCAKIMNETHVLTFEDGRLGEKTTQAQCSS